MHESLIDAINHAVDVSNRWRGNERETGHSGHSVPLAGGRAESIAEKSHEERLLAKPQPNNKHQESESDHFGYGCLLYIVLLLGFSLLLRIAGVTPIVAGIAIAIVGLWLLGLVADLWN